MRHRGHALTLQSVYLPEYSLYSEFKTSRLHSKSKWHSYHDLHFAEFIQQEMKKSNLFPFDFHFPSRVSILDSNLTHLDEVRKTQFVAAWTFCHSMTHLERLNEALCWFIIVSFICNICPICCLSHHVVSQHCFLQRAVLSRWHDLKWFPSVSMSLVCSAGLRAWAAVPALLQAARRQEWRKKPIVSRRPRGAFSLVFPLH